MGVLDDLRKKREATAYKPADNDYGSNIPTDSPSDVQISQVNGVNEQAGGNSGQVSPEITTQQAPAPAVTQNYEQPAEAENQPGKPLSANELFMQYINNGTPYTDAYTQAYNDPSMNEEEQKIRDRKEGARRNIAAFADAARLIGQGISTFGGGRVNIDQSSISHSNGNREKEQKKAYDEKVRRYLDGKYHAGTADITQKIREIQMRRQQERENQILANKIEWEEKKIKEQQAFEAEQRALDRQLKATLSANSNATTIASANIRKGSVGATEDKNYTYYPDGDNVVKIPKSKMSDANISRIYSELVKEYPGAKFKGSAMKNIAGMPIKDSKGNIVYEDKMPTPTQMQQIIGEYAGNSPKAMEIIRSLSEDYTGATEERSNESNIGYTNASGEWSAVPDIRPKKESAPASKKVVHGFGASKLKSNKQLTDKIQIEGF
ncbi:MAG: hypothetical protein RSE51_08170 [Bacteroidales bacterium]